MQPYLTDLASLKLSLPSPLILTNEEAYWYRERVHSIHFGLKPNLDSAGNKKSHSILSKALSKSRRRNTKS